MSQKIIRELPFQRARLLFRRRVSQTLSDLSIATRLLTRVACLLIPTVPCIKRRRLCIFKCALSAQAHARSAEDPD